MERSFFGPYRNTRPYMVFNARRSREFPLRRRARRGEGLLQHGVDMKDSSASIFGAACLLLRS
jgi:hypothetical protein